MFENTISRRGKACFELGRTLREKIDGGATLGDCFDAVEKAGLQEFRWDAIAKYKRFSPRNDKDEQVKQHDVPQ